MSIRLVLLIGAVAAFMGLAALAFWYRGNALAATAERDKAIAELHTAIDAKRAQEETIGRLRAEQARVDEILAGVSDQIADINGKLTESNAALAELKDQDETVRDYLSAPIPEPLRRLYDGSKGGGEK